MWNRIKTSFLKDNREFNVVIIGLDNSGKTTLIDYLENGGEGEEISNIVATKTPILHSIWLGNSLFRITDLGGQREYRHLWNEYLERAHGIIFVVDVINEARYNEAKQEFDDLIRKMQNRKQHPEPVPLILAINKTDLLNLSEIAIKQGEFIHKFNLNELNKTQNQWAVHMISASKGYGLPELMIWLYNILNNKKIQGQSVFKEFLIFKGGGIPLLNTVKDIEGESGLVSGLFEAITVFIKSIFNGKDINQMSWDDKRIIFLHLNDLVGVVLINLTANMIEARRVLLNLLNKIAQLELKMRTDPIIQKIYNDCVMEQMRK